MLERLEPMERSAVDVKVENHLAAGFLAHVAGRGGPVAFLSQIRFDIAAGVFEQIEIDAAFLPNGHERVAPILGQRISGKDDTTRGPRSTETVSATVDSSDENCGETVTRLS